MTGTEKPAYLTRRQVAQLFNVSYHTLASWACGDKGPPFRRLGAGSRGGRVYYKREEVEAFFAALPRGGGPAPSTAAAMG